MPAFLLCRESFADGAQKVLFVVPSEPLVWQVAAFFSQLLRDEGDVTTKVGTITHITCIYQDR